MLMSGRQSNEILPILGAFGLAAFRMLPSASKIIGSITNIKFGSAATSTIKSALIVRDEIYENVTQAGDPKGVEPLFKKIQLLNISYKYPNRNNSIISNLNLSINNGDIIGIIGESGSGKSTVIDIFLGLIQPQSGYIELDGKKLTGSSRLTWQSQIGYVPQSPYLLDKTILENVAFGVPLARIDETAVISALKKSQLLNFISTLPLGLKTQLGDNGVALSGGQRQRIGIARALYKKPKILVLDEATSALDKETEELLMSALSSDIKDKTIVLITHRQSTLKICNRIFEVRDSNIHEIFNQS
jgi:ABC-type bacteriocin/lantibiotic exporter with double-glycine peptidase domain